jgi:hypothetical protein
LIRLEFDNKNFVIRWSLEGQITEGVFAEYVKLSMEKVPQFRARALILDLTEATSFDVSPKALRDLAAKTPTLPSHLPRVIVAKSNITYGLSRMFTILSEQQRPHSYVVRSMDEAYQLLKMAEPEFQVVPLNSARQGFA